MKPFGLFNCGNSCFANAVLQCLLHTRPLISYHYQGLHSGTCPRGQWCFTCEFENLILRGKQGESPVSPVGILSNIKKIGSHFGHGREEDAHEFLRYAIDAMQSASTNGAVGAGKYSEDASLIQLTFGGYLRSEVKCMKCQAKSEQLERIMDLTVEIHGDIGSLEEALRQFTATEVLDGDNRYNCSRCKSFERAKKRLSVFQAPNVLTIALKRFQLGKFGKLNKPVSFPALLDMSPYASTVDRSALYSLYAVVVHEDVNNFTYSGHYICYVKSLKGNWYLINDREVTPVEFERVLKQNAYMLFYARNSPQAPGLIRNKTSQVFALAKSRSNETQASAQSCGESAAKENSRSMARWRQEHLYRTSRHCSSFQPSDLINGSLHFCHRDSSSDSLSLSWSDESSWSTESTRDSTSTDDLSDYLFGGSQPMRCSGALHSSSEDSNYITYLPSTSAKSFYHEPGEGLDVKGNHSLKSSFLYCDRTNHSSKLRDNYRGRETECSSTCGQKSSFLLRSSTVRERRHQTLY
ncbi:hypothetical protein HPP92_005473 [Vanilla planifolia]|uniref:USP domain-containing protein n=1 Tax=Vanilla planifolia TaxID=51239 RepID=A0A835RMS2_VANPL|nr:hypothetical protein HPP92_005473 [Vanilla planifolia]